MDILLKRSKVRDTLLILIGTFLMAVGVNMIYDPMELVTGGVTGIGIVIKHLTFDVVDGGIPVWITNILFNLPLFLVSFKVLGFKYVARTLFATVALTFFILRRKI